LDHFVRVGCMVSSFLFPLALSRAYIGGRGGASFLIKIMYEYDCKLFAFMLYGLLYWDLIIVLVA